MQPSIKSIEWDEALKLIHAVLEGDEPASAPELEGNDSNWECSRKAAVGLLAHGLREGADGFSYVHAAEIEGLILTANHAAPRDPDTEDFEERYRQFPNHVAIATMRGAAVELGILYLFWRSKDAESEIGKLPREALAKRPPRTHAPQQTSPLFDHLVGKPQQRRRQREPVQGHSRLPTLLRSSRSCLGNAPKASSSTTPTAR